MVGGLQGKRYLCAMFVLLLSFSLVMSVPASDNVDVSQDSIRTDTLREVTVRPREKLPVEEAIDKSLQRQRGIGVPTVGDILEKLSPGINDKITHPFAIKQRKKERRKKRSMKALDDFSKVKTFDELLREAYENQMRVDSLEQLKP